VNSERTDPSKPRPIPPDPPPAPKAPNPESEDVEPGPPPDFGKNPESEGVDAVGNADPGATVGSNRRPGSPSNPPDGAAVRSVEPVGSGSIPARAAADEDAEDENPSKPEPVPVPDRDGAALKLKVPEDSPEGEALNQFLWSASGARISEMALFRPASETAGSILRP
jgi:hypothetical protein